MDNKQLTETVDRLRCDLSATCMALVAIQNALTPEQRVLVLQNLAKASAQRQVLFDAPLPTPAAQEKLSRLRALSQAAEERIYQMLQSDLDQTGLS
jgi:hypothetical protein